MQQNNPEFDELVRQRLRDFIKSRSWSVSRFAARYVQAYAEAYSRMEAPGTSTARKIVEDNAHRLTEREAQVLDSFTGLNLHELWLEEQKKILLDKTEQYVIDGKPKPEFDSLTILQGRIAALEKKPKALTLDDVMAVARRYATTDADIPLVIWAYTFQLADIVRDNLLDSNVNVHIVDSRTADVTAAIAQASGKCILAVVSFDWALANDLRRRLAEDIVLFHVEGNPCMIEPMMSTPYARSPHPLYANMLRRCLEVHPDWPEWFSRQVTCCIESPWVRFPRLSDARQCMQFLTQLYCRQKDFSFPDEMAQLMAKGFPDNWLTDECDQRSLLTLMSIFDEWKSEHPDFAEKTILGDVEYLLMFGHVAPRTSEEWKQWLTERYYENLVNVDLPQAIDIVIAAERRSCSICREKLV